MPDSRPTLYLLCGKIAAGKSTLASRLSARPATILISEDHWNANLFHAELKTLEDYARYSRRLRNAMGPHVVSLLRIGVSAVLDFPANGVETRRWMRGIIEEADAANGSGFGSGTRPPNTLSRPAKPTTTASPATSRRRRPKKGST